MSIKHFVFSLVIATSIIGCKSSAQQTPPNGSSEKASADSQFISYESAIKLAKAENKVVLVDVYTDWCGCCKRLDKEVYPDPKVKAELTKYFAATKLNAESSAMHTFQGNQHSEQQMASVWGISSYPTILFVSPDEQVINRIEGYSPADDFAQVLKYIGTGAYKTTDFAAWKKTQS